MRTVKIKGILVFSRKGYLRVFVAKVFITLSFFSLSVFRFGILSFFSLEVAPPPLNLHPSTFHGLCNGESNKDIGVLASKKQLEEWIEAWFGLMN